MRHMCKEENKARSETNGNDEKKKVDREEEIGELIEKWEEQERRQINENEKYDEREREKVTEKRALKKRKTATGM